MNTHCLIILNFVRIFDIDDNIYTSVFPKTSHTTQMTYVDNTTILISNKDPNITAHNIQYHLNQISNWTHKWKVQIIENK